MAPEVPPVSLVWAAPAECESGDRVLERVGQLIGEGPHGAHVAAAAHVERSTRGYSATLVIEVLGERAERSFEWPTCDEVAGATALLLATLVGPDAKIGGEADEAPREPAPPAAGRFASEAARPVAPARLRTRFHLGPHVGAGFGPVPGMGLFGGASVWAERGRVRGGIGGAIWIPRLEPNGLREGAGVLVGMATGSIFGCASIFRPRFLPEPCLAVEAGAIEGAGRMLRRPEHVFAPWIAITPGVAIRLTGPAVPLVLAIDVPVGVVRPIFTMDDVVAYRAPILGVRTSLGVYLRLP